MYYFDIFPGNIWHDDVLRCGAYSGFEAGKGNPDMQDVPDTGPIPEGRYTVGEVFEHHPHLGAFAVELVPDPANEMYGRSGFFWHGEEIGKPPGHASHGCIISARVYREEFVASGEPLTVRRGDPARPIARKAQVVTHPDTPEEPSVPV